MNPEKLLDQFSTHLKNTIARSLSLAVALGQEHVEPIHLLVALTEEKGSLGTEILLKFDLDKKALSPFLPHGTPTKDTLSTTTVPELSLSSKKILEKAILVAYEYEHTYVGTEHLLAGLIAAKDQIVTDALAYHSASLEDIQEQLDIVLQSTSKFPDMEDINSMVDQLQQLGGNAQPNATPPPQANRKKRSSKKQKKQPPLFDVFTVNLTHKQTQKSIDPVIGREKEVERLIHILCRRTKNNPVLVGEPGVGKTAIVEGLAKRIVEGNVPDVLKRKKILSLDLTLLVAGTIYRGEFEARLKQIIDELMKRKDHIVFIDELHNIIGAGSNQGTMDAANILKPALARGKLRCIGATTIDEYKKHIANDPALARRFQSITVEEPTKDEAKQVLAGIKPHYEAFHHTEIAEEAIDAAVELSSRYVHDSFLPDKAIDLIDEACARVRADRPSSTSSKQLAKITDAIAAAEEKKEKAILGEAFDKAKGLKEKIEQLEKDLKKAKKVAKKEKIASLPVGRDDVAHVLANRLNIAPDILLEDEWIALNTLAARIGETIFGHEETINGIAEAIQRAQLGGDNRTKPLASFLFAGPSGVGKTACAKALAKALYRDEKALIKLDMSEFAESHGVSKILGSPAGYVGYKERNHFLEALKERPYSVILLDEFDKAHPDVRKLLLQMLDEGTITNSRGKKVSLRHAIVIMTTNIGAQYFRSSGIGFGNKQTVGTTEADRARRDKHIESALKDEFGPALMSRVQHTALFSPLQRDTVSQIISHHLDHLTDHLRTARDIEITIPTKTIEALTKELFTEDTGARHVDTAVESILHKLVVSALKQKGKSQYTFTKHKNEYTLA